MFAYIDPTIAKQLLEKGLLFHVDSSGARIDSDSPEVPYLSLLGPVPLPITVDGEEQLFRWYAFVRRSELGLIQEAAEHVRQDDAKDLVPLLSTYMQVSSILVHGEFESIPAPIVRVHSSCVTSDVFGSRRCECGPQLDEALRRIVAEGAGALVYMSSHEGRGIGLWAKAVTYLLQDMGRDTYQANTALGLPEDSRTFIDAAVVLRALRPAPAVRLLTNNPLKVEELRRGGVDVTEVLPLVVGFTDHNLRYMKSKQSKGHLIPEDELDE